MAIHMLPNLAEVVTRRGGSLKRPKAARGKVREDRREDDKKTEEVRVSANQKVHQQQQG